MRFSKIKSRRHAFGSYSDATGQLFNINEVTKYHGWLGPKESELLQSTETGRPYLDESLCLPSVVEAFIDATIWIPSKPTHSFSSS